MPLAELLTLLTAEQTATSATPSSTWTGCRRCGYPEVIFGANKTPAQLLDIAARMLEAGHEVLITRVSDEHVAALSSPYTKLRHNPAARTIRITPEDFPAKTSTAWSRS